MSMLVFLIILTILVLVHEWGHFITAKKSGIKVEQFAIGFGPKLFSRTHDGTVFSLCLIPLGGYVKMAGDERANSKGAQDEYFSKSVGTRALVVLMGPVVNLVMAYVCFWFVFVIGFVDMDLSAKQVDARLGQVLAGKPADKAGLRVGDRILTIDHKPVSHWPDVQDYVAESKGTAIQVTLERDGQTWQKSIVPKEQVQRDIFGREHRTRKIGVGPMQIQSTNDLVIKRYGFWGSFPRAGRELWDITVKTYTALYEMLIGLRSAKEAMGIVGMFFVIKFALSVSFSFLLHIVGVISASLAIFNLLPLIPLDGGHLFLLGIEKLRGKALSAKMDAVVMRLGFGLIIILALFVFYVDFERIGLIDKVLHLFNRTG